MMIKLNPCLSALICLGNGMQKSPVGHNLDLQDLIKQKTLDYLQVHSDILHKAFVDSGSPVSDVDFQKFEEDVKTLLDIVFP